VVRTQQQKTFLDIRGWDPEGAPLEPGFRVLRLGLENEEKKNFFFRAGASTFRLAAKFLAIPPVSPWFDP
jgi:hypothetical protein